MFSKYRFWIGCVVFALLLVFSLVFLEKVALRDEPKVLASYLLLDGRDDEGGGARNRRAITLPFFENSPVNRAVYEYIVEIEWKNSSVSHFRVIPDDYLESITVNGQLMAEERYSGPGRGDWNNGIVVDFDSYLHEGKNELLFRIADHGGRYGMDFRGAGLLHSHVRIAALTLCILLVLALVFWVLRRFRIDRVLIILILLALAWQLVSLGVRDYQKYGHDLYEGNKGHINYIQYIADKGKLPPAHGWSYYHPPLYYIFGAGVWSFAKFLDLADPFKPLQLLSLVFYWIFLTYALRLLSQFVKQPWIYRAAAALLLFWPAGSLCAIRITNDALLYPLFMMTLFYGHRWFVGEKPRDLLLASICCGMGFFAKISIFPLGVILGCLVLWRLYKKCATLPLRYALAAIFILTGGFFFSAVDKWVYEIKANHSKWYMAPFSNLSVIRMNEQLYVEKNKVIDFIVPDTKAWFDVPYISPFRDSRYAPGNDNFWNYVLKTSLFGQFSYPVPFREKFLAPFMNGVFIFLFALMCYGLPMFWRRRQAPYMPLWGSSLDIDNIPKERIREIGRSLGEARANSKQYDFRFVLVVTAVFLLLVAATRIIHATPTQIEFRYIMSLMPVMVVAVAAGLIRLAARERRWLFIFGNVIVFCFALASLVFYFGI
jgi:hypothetical protein